MPLCSTSCPNLVQKWLGIDATGYAKLTAPEVQNSECVCTWCMPSCCSSANIGLNLWPDFDYHMGSHADNVYGCGTSGRRLLDSKNATSLGPKLPSKEELQGQMEDWCINRTEVRQAVSGQGGKGLAKAKLPILPTVDLNPEWLFIARFLQMMPCRSGRGSRRQASPTSPNPAHPKMGRPGRALPGITKICDLLHSELGPPRPFSCLLILSSPAKL